MDEWHPSEEQINEILNTALMLVQSDFVATLEHRTDSGRRVFHLCKDLAEQLNRLAVESRLPCAGGMMLLAEKRRQAARDRYLDDTTIG